MRVAALMDKVVNNDTSPTQHLKVMIVAGSVCQSEGLFRELFGIGPGVADSIQTSSSISPRPFLFDKRIIHSLSSKGNYATVDFLTCGGTIIVCFATRAFAGS